MTENIDYKWKLRVWEYEVINIICKSENMKEQDWQIKPAWNFLRNRSQGHQGKYIKDVKEKKLKKCSYFQKS